MNGLKFDGTINLPILITICAGMIAVGGWITSVNSKLDTVAQLVVSVSDTGKRLDSIERQILVNRAETIKNRETYLNGEAEK